MHNYCIADRYTQCFHDCPGCNHAYMYRSEPDPDREHDKYKDEYRKKYREDYRGKGGEHGKQTNVQS